MIAHNEYPFGMLMPKRVFSDTPLTRQSVYNVSTYDDTLISHSFDAGVEGWVASSNPRGTAPTMTATNGVLQVETDKKKHGIYRNYSTTVGQNYKFVIHMADSSECDSIKVRIQEISPISLMQEHDIGNGAYSFEFTATEATTRARVLRWDEDGSGPLNFYIESAYLLEVQDTSYNDTMFLATSNGYRYAFNGKEQDPEWNGVGAMYDYGFRIYDPRIGKFLSVDPLSDSFPMFSPYQYASLNPMSNIDLDGLEGTPSDHKTLAKEFKKALIKIAKHDGEKKYIERYLKRSDPFNVEIRETKTRDNQRETDLNGLESHKKIKFSSRRVEGFTSIKFNGNDVNAFVSYTKKNKTRKNIISDASKGSKMSLAMFGGGMDKRYYPIIFTDKNGGQVGFIAFETEKERNQYYEKNYEKVKTDEYLKYVEKQEGDAEYKKEKKNEANK